MKSAIILASFGTTYADTRKKNLDLIETEAKKRFPNFTITSAYTSNIVRSILKKRDGIYVESPVEAYNNLVKQGFSEIYIQPTHIIPGEEYEKLKINGCILGKTLLNENCNFDQVIEALDLTPLQDNHALIFMGHGSSHKADKFYEILENKLKDISLNNIFIATGEGSKTLNDILPIFKEKKIKEVQLMPFMLVAGDHAQNDMAGDEPTSWKHILEENNYSVNIILKGLGEYPKIRELIFKSLTETIENSRKN